MCKTLTTLNMSSMSDFQCFPEQSPINEIPSTGGKEPGVSGNDVVASAQPDSGVPEHSPQSWKDLAHALEERLVLKDVNERQSLKDLEDAEKPVEREVSSITSLQKLLKTCNQPVSSLI